MNGPGESCWMRELFAAAAAAARDGTEQDFIGVGFYNVLKHRNRNHFIAQHPCAALD